MRPIGEDLKADSQSDGESDYESSEERAVRRETVRADGRKTKKQRRKESERLTQVVCFSCGTDTRCNSCCCDRRSLTSWRDLRKSKCRMCTGTSTTQYKLLSLHDCPVEHVHIICWLSLT